MLGIVHQNFFSNDKRFSTRLMFGQIPEQNLIIAIINNQQQSISSHLFKELIVFKCYIL